MCVSVYPVNSTHVSIFFITLRYLKKKKHAPQRVYFLFINVFLLYICKFEQQYISLDVCACTSDCIGIVEWLLGIL